MGLIHVTGTASVGGTPDLVNISATVSSELQKSQTQALEVQAGKMFGLQKVLEKLKEEHPKIKFGTSQYEYGAMTDNRTAQHLGFQATQKILISAPHEYGGKILDAIHPFVAKSETSFGISNALDLKKQAVEKAIQDAKQQARNVAKELGLELGKAVEFTANLNNWDRGGVYAMSFTVESASAPTLPVAEQQISVTINVSFETT